MITIIHAQHLIKILTVAIIFNALFNIYLPWFPIWLDT